MFRKKSMTFKDKLDLLHRLEGEISSSRLMLRELKRTVAKMTPIIHYVSGGQGGESSSLKKMSAKITDMTEEVNRKTDEYFELKQELIEIITRLPEPVQRMVLMTRGINGKTWSQTAETIHYSIAHSKRLMEAAIAEVEKLNKT